MKAAFPIDGRKKISAFSAGKWKILRVFVNFFRPEALEEDWVRPSAAHLFSTLSAKNRAAASSYCRKDLRSEIA
jgi:hypothetical protein